ncbi:MAG: ion channel [Deltaproteobacteria bacterium]
MAQITQTSRILTLRILGMFKHPMFGILTLVGNGTIVVAAYLFFLLEEGQNPKLHSYLDALWWAVSTVTTVGDGEILPLTFWGRILGILMMIFGTALFCSFTALFSTVLMGFKLEQVEEEIADVEEKVSELKTEVFEDELALNDLISKLESTLQALVDTKKNKKKTST